MKNKQDFFDKCKSLNCCKLCRSSLTFRKQMNLIFNIGDVNFVCPHNNNFIATNIKIENNRKCIPCSEKKKLMKELLEKAKKDKNYNFSEDIKEI